MIFYPDNEKRATRLQQLVDSMANMQTDVKHMAEQMDEKNKLYRPAIDKLLKSNSMDSVDDVVNKAAAQMTPEERKGFEALINAVKSGKAGIDVTYFVACLLMVPEGVVLTGNMAISIVRWGSRIVNVNALAGFFRATEVGTEAAAAAAEVVATGARKAEKILQEAGEVGGDVNRAALWLGRIDKFFRVLGAVGLVVTIIVGVIEAIQGAEQKRNLIEAIQGLQPARLTTAFFKQEGMSIMQQLVTLQLYLDASPGGSDPDPDMAAYISKKLIKAITEENHAIDLNKLESDLETQDRTSTLFYGDDDLKLEDVVDIASKK